MFVLKSINIKLRKYAYKVFIVKFYFLISLLNLRNGIKLCELYIILATYVELVSGEYGI